MKKSVKIDITDTFFFYREFYKWFQVVQVYWKSTTVHAVCKNNNLRFIPIKVLEVWSHPRFYLSEAEKHLWVPFALEWDLKFFLNETFVDEMAGVQGYIFEELQKRGGGNRYWNFLGLMCSLIKI